MVKRIALDCNTAEPDRLWDFCHFAARLTWSDKAMVTLIDPPPGQWKDAIEAARERGDGHRFSVLRSDRPLPEFDRVYKTVKEASDDSYGWRG